METRINNGQLNPLGRNIGSYNSRGLKNSRDFIKCASSALYPIPVRLNNPFYSFLNNFIVTEKEKPGLASVEMLDPVTTMDLS